MPSTKNISAVAALESKLASSQALYLADYQGLTVKAQTELRRLVTGAGGELLITKNRLLKIALINKGLPADEIGTDLTGANITLFASSDPIAPLKALVDFAKKQETELPRVKSGILDKKVLSVQQVLQLASLPSKAELIGKLLGTLLNPARNLVGVLTAPTRNLVFALSAISKK